jgi:hypothetical protein
VGSKLLEGHAVLFGVFFEPIYQRGSNFDVLDRRSFHLLQFSNPVHSKGLMEYMVIMVIKVIMEIKGNFNRKARTDELNKNKIDSKPRCGK